MPEILYPGARVAPTWHEPPSISQEMHDALGDMRKQIQRHAISGLKNIVADTVSPYRHTAPDGSVSWSHATKEVWTSEEDNMLDHDCQPVMKFRYTHLDEADAPVTTKTTLKRLRKQAKRIRKEIADVKKQAKREAKAEATELAKVKQVREDRELALKAFRAVVKHAPLAVNRTEAAEKLITYTQEY